jgi:acetyl esterase/lipase
MSELTRRNFVRNTLAAGLGLSAAPNFLQATQQQPSASASASASTTTPPIDIYGNVDPELVGPIKGVPTKSFDKDVLAKDRKNAMAFPPWPAPAPQPFQRRIPGPPDNPEINVVIVDPTPGEKNRPAFLDIHGGGYIAGFPGWLPTFLQTAAMHTGCVVVSPEYRLSPEAHFPAALEDNYATLRWMHANADSLGIDRKRIAVGGESAGGGHAAMLAIAARDRKEFPILFQLLIYPMLDDRTGSTRAVPPQIGQFVWNTTSNLFGWTSLLGVPAGSATVPAGAVPARVENLAGLPPAFISVGDIDLFVDEDLEYARRLIAAGVPTEVHVVPGAYHGYDVLVPDAGPSKRFTESWKVALKRAFIGR